MPVFVKQRTATLLSLISSEPHISGQPSNKKQQPCRHVSSCPKTRTKEHSPCCSSLLLPHCLHYLPMFIYPNRSSPRSGESYLPSSFILCSNMQKGFIFFHFSTMWPYRRGMQPPILIAETPLRRDFKERQKLGKQTMVMKENVLKSFYIKRDRQPFLAHTPLNG